MAHARDFSDRYERWYETEKEVEANLPKAYIGEAALSGPLELAKGA